VRSVEQLKRRREWETLKQQKLTVDQRLAILQAQIEPHFLFNTLASVRSLVTQDQARAAAMIDGLANYLRVTLPKLRTTDSTSTLGEQLEICTSYLELMRLRMGERFSFVVDVPQSLRDAAVPALLLLPLVENAVTHGVEPKPGASTIQISARLEHLASPALRIEIKDDGVGLSAGQRGKDVGKGMGLANIRSQLNLRYGTNASLEVSSRAGGGTSAVLVIPS
jgi:sensor histidine kinase YesM